jgi:hypothetical protein
VATVEPRIIIDCSSSQQFQSNSKGLTSSIVSAVVGTDTVPVVAPAGTVTVCEVVV